MYIPNNMQMEPGNSAHHFIQKFGFATIISEPLEATHLPMLLNETAGELGTLYGHIAKNNPHWKNFQEQKALVIFNGPHAYISPTWYANKPAVPTWNYAAVHIVGRVKILDDQETLNVIENTVRKYQPELLKDQLTMPQEYRKRLAKAIVGFKIEISKIEAKHKLGQDRKNNDQKGVVNGLGAAKDYDSKNLLDYMQSIGIGIG